MSRRRGGGGLDTNLTYIHGAFRQTAPPLELYDVAAHACVGYSAGTRIAHIADKHPIHAEMIEAARHGYTAKTRTEFHFKSRTYFRPPPNHLDRIVCGWSEMDMLDNMDAAEFDMAWQLANARRDPPMAAADQWMCRVCATKSKKRAHLMSARHLGSRRHNDPSKHAPTPPE